MRVSKLRLPLTVGLIAAILLGGSLLGAPSTAQNTDYWQMLPYDLSLPLHEGLLREAGAGLGLLEPDCDQQGAFAVRFCDTLEAVHQWNRVTMLVYDHGNPTPVPIGAKYTFFDADGNTLREGIFCEITNVWVPSNAKELLVEVAHVESFGEGRLGICAMAPFPGEVWLRWHTVADPVPTPSPINDAECICECDCHPLYGCECECRPRDPDNHHCGCKLED
jgi:hypothetical protein